MLIVTHLQGIPKAQLSADLIEKSLEVDSLAKRYGRQIRGSDGGTIAKIGREVSGGVVLLYVLTVRVLHGRWL